MKKRKVLILDKSYQVMDVMCYHKALQKWGRSLIDPSYPVHVIASYEDITMNVNGVDMNPPSILRFNSMRNLNKAKHAYQSFSRRNVWKRDNKECQFCGKPLKLPEMHWDHIIPKCEGGKTNWKNLVCCCKKCNDKKADKPLKDCGMKLRSKPFAPLAQKTIYENRIERLRNHLKYLPSAEWLIFVKHILDKKEQEKWSNIYG